MEARERGEGFACLSFWSIRKTAGIFHCLTLLIPVWNTSWNSMEIYGNPWNSMEFHGTSMEYQWSSVECHGVPGSIHGVPWNAMEFHGVPWGGDGVPWNAMKFHGVSLEVHGIPWGSLKYRWSSMECHSVSMEFDWIPCGLYEKIHRNSVIKQLINLLTTCSSLHFLLDRKIGNIWKLSKSKIVHLV